MLLYHSVVLSITSYKDMSNTAKTQPEHTPLKILLFTHIAIATNLTLV